MSSQLLVAEIEIKFTFIGLTKVDQMQSTNLLTLLQTIML